ncbi:MAG: DUF1566 domain-containing protein [Nitrospinaceae bacterium]|nr:DUF1566 domain-containing protein [Nitrospinaceae bacterium]
MKTLLIVLLALFLALPNFAAERGIKRVQLSSLAPVETPYLSGKYRALVIGNNNYDDPEKLWPSLKTAVADAEAVAEILKTDYGFAEITLLKNTKQRDIVRAFNQLVTNAQENDSVLIYYAGHGYLNEDTKEGFWIPVDAEGRDDSTFVSNAIIKTKLSVIADKARHVLLVSDSCFSGALLREGNRGMSLDQKNERYYQKVAKKKSVQILAAGGLEFVDDNYKGAGHSPFTYYLLQSLKDNNVRYFEATDLSQETSRNVSVNTQQTPESGVLQGAGHAGGEFFFLRKKTAGAKVSTPSAPASKPIVSAPRKYRADEEMWELVKDSYDSEDLNIFLEEHPESPLAGVARLKLKRLERKQAKAKAEEQQQLAEEEKRLEEERKQLEAEKQKIAEAKRKAEPERKKQQELAALRQKQESESKQSAKSPAGTVTDTSTGLMWQKRTDGREYNWEDARRYCNDLQLGGYLDWVLPSKEVLADMRDKKDIFGPYNRVYYWSSTNYMSSSSHAWHVGLYNDKVSDLIKTSSSSVRCVRGGRQNQAAIGPKQESTPSGTVIDQATGLMWQYEQDGVIRNWEKAKKYCRSLFLGGYSDWELPSKEVLEDMLNKKDLFDPFELEQWYWTSTSNLKDKSRAWSVGFHYGYAERYSKNSGGYALCVRGGRQDQAAIGPKQESTPSGTVTDQATGLMWQKKSDGIERNWEAAKSYCGDLTLAGYSDWELPSKDVLKDMFEKKNLFDPYNRESWYWSSTSNVDSSSSAWFANFYSDSVFYGSKSGSYYARCVRDGSPEQQAKGPRSADGRYLDHGNGAIKDTRTGLMWTKKDSYADLGECLDWDDSRRYVSALRTGGYSDWRLPTVKELKGIYEGSKSNNMAYDHDSRYPLHLDSIFADWAAYFYWSSEEAGSCCARHVSFNPDQAYENHRAHCYDGGVRAVRSWKKEELAVLRPKQEALSSGTVIDQATGLIWQKKPDGGELNWEDAKSYCRNLQLGGYSDWELPSKEVLEDMLGKKNLFDPFKRGERYWTTSSVTYGGKPIPRIIDFDNDFVSSSDKHFGRHARCVRGGQQNQSAISSKQESSPSGTVFDSSTGLMWLKRPDGTERNWEKSKSYCRNLKLAGYSDWKLPSKDVLEDMLGKKNLFDPYNRESWYWSSTSNVDSSWFANFYSDSVFYGSKSGSYYVRCVRGGK